MAAVVDNTEVRLGAVGTATMSVTLNSGGSGGVDAVVGTADVGGSLSGRVNVRIRAGSARVFVGGTDMESHALRDSVTTLDGVRGGGVRVLQRPSMGRRRVGLFGSGTKAHVH